MEDAVNNALFQACHAACPQYRRRMLNSLQELEAQPEIIFCLTKVIDVNQSGTSLSSSSRQLGAILLKNIATKMWRSDPQPDQEEARSHLMSFLSTYWEEPDCLVAVQLQVLAANLARSFWFTDWKNFFCSMVRTMQREDCFLASYRASCTLFEVFSDVSAHTHNDPKLSMQFQDLCLKIFPAISKVWATHLKALQAELSQFMASPDALSGLGRSRDQALENRIAKAKVISKTVRVVVETVFTQLQEKYQCFSCFWSTYLGGIQIFSKFIRGVRPQILKLLNSPSACSGDSVNAVPATATSAGKHDLPELNHSIDDDADDIDDYYLHPAQVGDRQQAVGLINVTNLVLKLLKTLAQTPVVVIRKHPLKADFILAPMLKFYYEHLMDEYSVAPQLCIEAPEPPTKLLPLKYVSLSAVSFLATVLTCSAYRGDSDAAVQANEQRVVFFTSGRVGNLYVRLQQHFLHYSAMQLGQWADAPEEFFTSQQDNEGAYSTTFRSAGMQLLKGLVDMQPEVVVKLVLDDVLDVPRQLAMCAVAEPSSLIKHGQLVLSWDATYLCVGLVVDQLLRGLTITPTQWLMNGLGQVLQALMAHPRAGAHPSAGQQILRARLVCVLAAYMQYFDGSMHSTVLRVLVQMITSDSDIVVRLNAVRAVEALLACPEVNISILTPHVLETVNALCSLVQCCEESESRAHVLQVISEVLRLVGVQECFDSFCAPLGDYLSRLWASLSPSDVVRGALLDVLAVLVRTAGARSFELHAICLPVVLDALGAPQGQSSANLALRNQPVNRDLAGVLLEDATWLLLTIARNCQPEHFHSGLARVFVEATATIMVHIYDVKARAVIPEVCTPELKRRLLLLVEACCVAAPGSFLPTPAVQLSLSSMLQKLFFVPLSEQDASSPLVLSVERSAGCDTALHKCLQAMLMSAPEVAVEVFNSIGLVRALLCATCANAPCPTLSGFTALYKITATSNRTLCVYLCVLVRMMLCTPTQLIHALDALRLEMMQSIICSPGSGYACNNLTVAMLTEQLTCVVASNIDHLSEVPGGCLFMRQWVCAVFTLVPTEKALVAHRSRLEEAGDDGKLLDDAWVWGQVLDVIQACNFAVHGLSMLRKLMAALAEQLGEQPVARLRATVEELVYMEEFSGGTDAEVETDLEGRHPHSSAFAERFVDKVYLQALEALELNRRRVSHDVQGTAVEQEESFVTSYILLLRRDSAVTAHVLPFVNDRLRGLHQSGIEDAWRPLAAACPSPTR